VDGIVRLAASCEHLPTNIGNPSEFTMLECAEVVLEVTGSASKLVFEALPQDDPRQRCPDISKAKKLLGWEPKIDLRSGLQMSLDYFRQSLAAESRGSKLAQ
jgi:dTDP-glucose 4,6-dehydratase